MIKKSIYTVLLLIIGAMLFLCWSISSQILTVNYQTEATQIANLNKDWDKGYNGFIAEMGQPHKFEVASVDGTNIVGYHFTNVDSIECGVVLSHGHTSGKTAMLKYADMFWDCGCDIVVYDHRGHGESEKVAPTAGIKEKDDHVAVTEWLKDKTGLNNSQIGWMGASWGAATVLLAGAYDSEMAFIVADSPYQDWYTAIYERGKRMYGGIVDVLSPVAMQLVNVRADIDYKAASPLLAAQNVTEPIFLIHSQTDESTRSTQSVNISKNLNSNSKFVHSNWGSGHCRDINVNPEEYRTLLYAFLQDQVGDFGRCTAQSGVIQ